MPLKSIPDPQICGDNSELQWFDCNNLKNGIWPRSRSLWLASIYLALYIIRPWEQLFPMLAEIHPERFFILILITAVFMDKNNRLKFTWQSMSVLLFYSCICIASLFALQPSLSWEPFYAYTAVVIYYFILLIVIKGPYELVFIILTYIAVMCVYLSKATWEFFINGQHRYDMGVVRMIGIENTFGGPNNLAMSIVASLPFAVFLWKHQAIYSITWPTRWKKRLRQGLLLYGALSVISVILTNSRSGLVGLLIFALILMFSGKGIGKKISYIISGLLILSLVWLIIPEENKGRIRTIWAPEEGPANAQVSAEGRIEGYKAGMEMFRKYPITGVGVGNFIAYRIPNIDGIALEAHNLAGQLLGETGIVGGFGFFALVSTVLLTCRSVIHQAKQCPSKIIMLFADVAIACKRSIYILLFLGIFGHNLYRANWLWLVAFSTLALIFAKKCSSTKQDFCQN